MLLYLFCVPEIFQSNISLPATTNTCSHIFRFHLCAAHPRSNKLPLPAFLSRISRRLLDRIKVCLCWRLGTSFTPEDDGVPTSLLLNSRRNPRPHPCNTLCGTRGNSTALQCPWLYSPWEPPTALCVWEAAEGRGSSLHSGYPQFYFSSLY